MTAAAAPQSLYKERESQVERQRTTEIELEIKGSEWQRTTEPKQPLCPLCLAR